MSHPTMGAWIEICHHHYPTDLLKVAPHAGCVDWNHLVPLFQYLWIVSHPTMGAWIEIVKGVSGVLTVEVAPHDGCVDWNLTYMSIIIVVERSHPTMGAWIEIALISFALTLAMIVAPHDGCVDWNGKFRGMDFSDVECHIPYRGAWIEMRPTV